MNRRNFLLQSFLFGTAALAGKHAFGALEHRYELAPEALLPKDIRSASTEVREAYRFAIANRDTLRYIPCYCGCGADGHTSNASCYIQDNSTPKKLLVDLEFVHLDEFQPVALGELLPARHFLGIVLRGLDDEVGGIYGGHKSF